MYFDEESYKKQLEKIKSDFVKDISEIRTGQVNRNIFDKIEVVAYGSNMPLSGVAKVNFDGPISVKLEVFDPSQKKTVLDALINADMGASVNDQGDHIRVSFHPLTEEDRREKVKDLNLLLESSREKARGVRRDFMQKLKSLEGVAEDQQKADEKKVQGILDDSIALLEKISKEKQIEILPGK